VHGELPPAPRSVLKSRPAVVPGPSGNIEAAIDALERPPGAIAVLCHPHPLQQGTMSNKVVTTLARAFVRLGADVVRFNFRGVGSSAGRYADGIGERADALAVAEWSRTQWPGLPLYLGGFSFGGGVALASAAELQPRGLVTVAPPVEKLPSDFAPPACPWLLVHGSADDVVPVAPTRSWVATLAKPPRLLVLDGVGHFFHGKLRVLEDAVTDFFAADFNAAQL
jgi:alpha/beta superfamily hydrolase